MKEQILKIANGLRNGVIDEQKARILLLCLFGLSGSVCIYNKGDYLISEESGEVYELTAIGKRKCLVEVISENGGRHEFERRIETVNKYKLHYR